MKRAAKIARELHISMSKLTEHLLGLGKVLNNVNQFKNKRADFDLALSIYQYHDLIKDDVSGWYDKIFE